MTNGQTRDPVVAAIVEAVTAGRDGAAGPARESLLDLWATIGPPLHRCTLAHYLADLYPDPAQALVWDIRALDAADTITDERVRQHDAYLHVAGFLPSLHLDVADGYRRLGSFDAAREHLENARRHGPVLADDAYGDLVRTGIEDVGAAIEARSVDRISGP
ncbi:hypothetical protein DW322_19575 [Rhodococcus rhodnii]|uniref:Tetratricopeptide repeat protein n=2 Tax=Rhodococcus rhodnii TaxID=38312 RepID=R7WPH0_9NOCA|nr:hypothetical protein [Rhodococcus rhodnii]EOM77208.1 hypothetical protein Rrhod_1456 [Rhodococcus rhodnii LMG 5362]TXG91972.1 hypothetical protein DW322_19575 [Rhodococcus rhodnii]